MLIKKCRKLINDVLGVIACNLRCKVGNTVQRGVLREVTGWSVVSNVWAPVVHAHPRAIGVPLAPARNASLLRSRPGRVAATVGRGGRPRRFG